MRLLVDVAISFWWNCCSQILFGGDDGARTIGAIDDVGRRRSSAASYGVIGNDRQILQHRQWGRVHSLAAFSRAREAKRAARGAAEFF